MKRWLSGLLILVLALFAMAGCGGSQNQSQNQNQTQAQTQAAETAKETIAASETAAAESLSETETLTAETEAPRTEAAPSGVSEDGSYTSKEEVALYIHTYGHLPENFITKKEAQKLGWDNKKGNLQDVAPGMSIGGDRFGNYEGLLPEADKRKYFECDIDYEGGYRDAKRIIFSNDGLIFYTDDHYKTFEQLY